MQIPETVKVIPAVGGTAATWATADMLISMAVGILTGA